MINSLDFYVNAGFLDDQYGLGETASPPPAEYVWPPHEDVPAETEAELVEAFRATTGLTDLPCPAEDLAWTTVAHVHGRVADIENALTALIVQIGRGPIGADDDTFDYWPSAVRYALRVAAHLDEAIGDRHDRWTNMVTWVARGVIFDLEAEFAPILLDATGVRRGGDVRRTARARRCV